MKLKLKHLREQLTFAPTGNDSLVTQKFISKATKYTTQGFSTTCNWHTREFGDATSDDASLDRIDLKN